MTKTRNVTIETKEVAWSDGKPTKYQVIAEFPVSEKRTLRLLGDPKGTKDAAYNSFYDELALWKTFLNLVDSQV